jgi:N-acetylmuramoyl-L-alanine amidase
MRWSKGLLVALAAIALLSCTLLLSLADPAKQFTIYTPQSSYSIEILDRQGQLYIGLMELLEPLGATGMRSGDSDWVLQLNKIEARFTEGKDKAKIRGNSIALSGNVLVENHRVLVPLNASFSILSSLLHKNIDFHPAGRRIFVDNAGIHFTSELKKGEKSSLLLNFSQPVNPSVNQEGNKSKLVFKREPIISDITNQPFDDKTIRSLNFSEDNGNATITITGDSALHVSLGSDGKTILVQVVQPPAPPVASVSPQAPAPQPSPAPSVAAQSSPTPEPPIGTQGHTPPAFLVMIDPSHGGDDRGAYLADKLDEKDLTLSVARKLKTELQDRGIAVRLLRDADINLSLEQRAELTNAQHAAVYVAIHAGVSGQEVRVYTSALTSPSVGAGQFLPWETAQASSLSRSQTLAQTISGELRKKDVQTALLTTPLRPLNNIVAPAVAIELSSDRSNTQDLVTQRVQNVVAAAVASGIAQVRSQIEAQK